jgi:hypothetical protein
MLTALGKWTELGTHVRGAVRNGVSEVEIREALLQARFDPPILFISWKRILVIERGALMDK